ncbi:MAG: CARDB domain-containing protein, partial [Myxococcota bacterium]
MAASTLLAGLPGCSLLSGSDDNNTAQASRAMTSGPDLVVTEISGPYSARPGESFIATVTVCNHGNSLASSNGTLAELFLESSTEPDTSVGNLDLWGDLAPGQCNSGTIWTYSPYSAGEYTLRADADPQNGVAESNESNNTTSGERILLGHDPDLVITEVSAPLAAAPGEMFAVQVTGCNRGQNAITDGSAQVAVVLSSDPNIDSPVPSGDDILADTAGFGHIDIGGCETVSVQAHAGYGDGIFTLGVVADDSNTIPELDENNNIHLAGSLGIGHRPEPVVTAITTASATVMPGQSFDVAVTVCNHGTSSTSGPTIDLVLSSDALITESDPAVGGVPIGSLDPGECTTQLAHAYSDQPDGLYKLGVRIDPMDEQTEFFEDNNTALGPDLGIGSEADLVITDIAAPAVVGLYDPFELRARVCNQGQISSPSTGIEVVLSTDSAIDTDPNLPGGTDDLPLTYLPVPDLDQDACTWVSGTASWYNNEGTYYLGALIDRDGYVAEINDDNNSMVGDRIALSNKADLIISALSGPPSAQPWQNIDIAVTACNQGMSSSSYANVEIYLSSDPVFSADDESLGADSFLDLGAGSCATRAVPGYVSDLDGPYYIIARIDAYQVEDEAFEDNNLLVGDRIGVGNRPDFVITAISGPATAQPSSHADVTVTTCNQGQSGGSVHGEVYLSSDTVINESDNSVAPLMSVHLEPDECHTETRQVWIDGPDGTYYLGVITDSGNTESELIEDNNTAVSQRIGVGTGPDLVVSAISGPAVAMPGSHADFAITVCNQGQSLSLATGVEMWLSQDGTVDVNSDSSIGGAPIPDLAPGQCGSTSLPAMLPHDHGEYIPVAIVDPFAGQSPDPYPDPYTDPYAGQGEIFTDNN